MLMSCTSSMMLLWFAFGIITLTSSAASVCGGGQGVGDRVLSVAALHGDWEHSLDLLTSLGLVNEIGNWSGGNTTLVQTGDVVDRGIDGQRLYELLFKLQDQAPTHGGKVVLNIGNHELMLLQGDTRFVKDAELVSYGGKVGLLAAWSPNGVIGRELRRRTQAISVVKDVVYVHAGLLPMFLTCENKIEDINEEVKKLLTADAKTLSRTSSALLLGKGPMWTRTLALEDEVVTCKLLDTTLSILGCRRMVVGHTIQPNGKITSRCGGRLILADTMMSEAYTHDAERSAHNEAALEFYGNSKTIQANYPRRSNSCVALPTVEKSSSTFCNIGTNMDDQFKSDKTLGDLANRASPSFDFSQITLFLLLFIYFVITRFSCVPQ